MYCYKNAKIQNAIALQDRAFHYGDGCFTTAKVVDGQVQLWHRHLKRLEKACIQLQLQCDLSGLETTLRQIFSENQFQHGSLKIVISRGEGQRGYAFPDHPADIWIFCYPSKPIEENSLSWIDNVEFLDSRIGITMPTLVGIKTLNRLEQVMLKQEALTKQLAEALVADIEGRIVEGISSNCFMHVNNRWITPDLGYNGVHGIMREEILSRMQQLHIKCDKAPITIAQSSQIDALFFCNALHPMQIVKHFNGRALETEPAQQLCKQLKLNQIDALWLNQ